METIILAGGHGTRLQEKTEIKPKPMVEIGGKPILWHIMKIYGSYGHNEFFVALGYKGELIKNYFLNYYHLQSNLTVNLSQYNVDVHDDFNGQTEQSANWIVHLIDTGNNIMTGGRIKRLSHLLKNETFMMTYGDGVANVDIPKLIDFHHKHGKLATVTVVRPPARFGSLKFDGDQVTGFIEKPQMGEGWINGGFFVLEPGVFDYIDGDQTYFEQSPLERLANEGQLMAYNLKTGIQS